MIDMIKMTVVLTLIACAAALLIAFTNEKTEGRIAGQQAAAQEAALQQIIPSGATVTSSELVMPGVSEGRVPYWVVTAENATYYAFKVGGRGYSSTIQSLVCVDSTGSIIGMTILEQSETPGLGTRVQEVLSKKYFWNGLVGPKEQASPWFTEQFKGINLSKTVVIEKTIGEWHSVNDQGRVDLKSRNGITAITGSTISTRAVINSLSGNVMHYLQAIRG